MKEEKLEEINLWWDGPFKIEDIIDSKIESNEYNNTADRKGVYQIYGIHPLYGNDKLLYIGETTKSFKDRLKNRWQITDGNDDNNVRIYLGTCFSDKEDIEDNQDELIVKAEVLLINTMKPAFNSSNIQTVREKFKKRHYVLYNHNSYRDIYPILSSKYFLDDENIAIVMAEKLSKYYKATIKNDKFKLPNIEDVWIGVNQECWNETNQPLQMAISKSIGEDIIKKIKKKFGILEYEDKKYFYTSLSRHKNLGDKNSVKDIKDLISSIKKLIKP